MLNQIIVPILIVLSGLVCLEYAIPIAVGEFLAGMVGETLFGVSRLSWLDFFSHLGLISLMFLAGFEIDLKILYRNKYKSLLIGGSSFLVPFSLILSFCFWMGWPYRTAGVLGVALSTTSLAIVFPILREKGLLRTSAGQLLLSSAMVVDIASMLMLLFLFYQPSLANSVLLGALLAGFFPVKKFVFRLFERYQGNRGEFELKLLFLVILTFSLLAEEAGIHEAVICFVLGVLFSEIDPSHEALMEKLNSVVFSLLAPLFFFHVGSMIRFSEIDGRVIGLFFLFLFLSLGGKFLGTYAPLRLFSAPVARFGAVLFNYRLSFGLVAAIFGLRRGIIDSSLFNVILLCVLFSSLAAVVIEKKFLGTPALSFPLPEKAGEGLAGIAAAPADAVVSDPEKP